MRYSGNYVIHDTKQLIDINQSIQNFKALINIQCQNEDDVLDIVIVTQEELDNEDFEINYKKIQHKVKIEMEPENSTDVQNYIMVLRSDKPVKTMITIDVSNLDEKNTKINVNDEEEEEEVENNKVESVVKKDDSSMLPSNLFCKKNLIYIIIILFVGYMLYHFVFKNESTEDKKTEPNTGGNKDIVKIDNEPIDTFKINNLENIDLDVSTTTTKPTQSSSVLSSLRKLRNKN